MSTATMPRTRERNVWFLLAIPPLLFLLYIVIASVVVGFQTQGDAQAIANAVPLTMPFGLVVIQIVMLILFWMALRRDGLSLREIGWRVQAKQNLLLEIFIGAAAGVVLALMYIFFLSPLQINLANTFGNYVPADDLTKTLGSALAPFFIANVLLAPFVEENIYRGYALTRLAPRHGMPVAIVISCIFFGLLHWTGGFWYIVLTGVVAGGLFCGLLAWRKNIYAPFAAHLLLNLIEFVWIANMVQA